MEIIDSLFTGIFGCKNNKSISRDIPEEYQLVLRIIRKLGEPGLEMESEESEAWLKPCHGNSLHTPAWCCWVHLHHSYTCQGHWLPGASIQMGANNKLSLVQAQAVFHKDKRRLSEDSAPAFWLPSTPPPPITLEFLQIKMFHFRTIKSEKWPL